MIEYFTDEAGEHRYRIKGANGEPMATSEGYTSERDARRGFEALAKAVATALFYPPEWPQGIAMFDGLPQYLGQLRDGRLQPAAHDLHRMEGGPVQFGDDWPGLFIRGDACFAYGLALRSFMADKSDAFARAGIDGLITALEATNVNKS